MVGKTIIIFLLLSLAAILLAGRGWFLIAGYNMLNKEQRAKYNEVKLCRFMGMIMLGVVANVSLNMADEYWPGYYLANIGGCTFAVTLGVMFAFSLTGYFRKKL